MRDKSREGGANLRCRRGGLRRKPVFEFRPSPAAGGVAHRDRRGFFLPHNHDKALAAGEARIEEIALEHGVVLC